MIMLNIFVATTLISAHCRSPLLVAVYEPSSPPKAIHFKSHIMSWHSATSSHIGLLSTTLNVRTVASYWTESDKELFLAEVQKNGLDNLELLAEDIGSKTEQELEFFVSLLQEQIGKQYLQAFITAHIRLPEEKQRAQLAKLLERVMGGTFEGDIQRILTNVINMDPKALFAGTRGGRARERGGTARSRQMGIPTATTMVTSTTGKKSHKKQAREVPKQKAPETPTTEEKGRPPSKRRRSQTWTVVEDPKEVQHKKGKIKQTTEESLTVKLVATPSALPPIPSNKPSKCTSQNEERQAQTFEKDERIMPPFVATPAICDQATLATKNEEASQGAEGETEGEVEEAGVYQESADDWEPVGGL